MQESRVQNLTRIVALACLLFFWAASLLHLDRYPLPYYDETVILAPGYKLVTQGIYGADMFTGFHGMEQRFAQFMPLFSILQGVSVRLSGIGLFQLRFLPVAIGAVTLALAYALAARLFGRQAALWTALLLVTWQMQPGDQEQYRTGIPLLDFVRVARYDTFAALWGLAAFHTFWRARASSRPWYDLLSGVCAGLAGLSHIYGLFWGAALIAALLLDRAQRAPGGERFSLVGSASLVIAGIALVWTPYLLYIGVNWEHFVAQQMAWEERVDVLNPRFYWMNLLTEAYRYNLRLDHPETYARAGFWLFILGAPWAMIRLARLALRERNPAALYLVTATLVIASLLALLIHEKTPRYLPIVVTLLVIAVAALIVALRRSPRVWVRLACTAFTLIIIGQGLFRVGSVHTAAASDPLPADTMRQIRAVIPENARVLGLPEYWLAVPEPGYRSFAVPSFLAQSISEPNPFTAALEQVAPDYILIDRIMAEALPGIGEPSYGDQLRVYLDRHNGERIAVIQDFTGSPIEIYRVEQGGSRE